MAPTVWKHVLLKIPEQDVEMPLGSEILSAQGQDGEFCIWFKCDPDLVRVKRRVYTVGTGHEAPAYAQYVGTIQSGAFVFHIFAGAPSSSG